MESGGEITPVQNSIDDTLIAAAAAAAAIASSGSRRTQPPAPRRNWAARLSVYFCFGSPKNGRRINHAALFPEPTAPRTNAAAGEIPIHPPPPLLPFVAPPSSPASFQQSEPSSVVQSPSTGAPPFSPLSPNSPSSIGPTSIFAIGPYAHETELVSPPVFSAFTTEPSTAPFTPPESVHLTTPSSPEVPYGELLTSVNNSKNGETGDLQSYPSHPDSPIGHQLAYPSSGYSGHMHNGSSLLDAHITAAVPVADFSARLQHNDHAMDRRASFGLTAEDVARCLEKKIANAGDSVSASFRLAPTSSGSNTRESNDTMAGLYIDETYHDLPEKARRSLSLRLNKEFNFNIDDCTTVDPSVGSSWWANDKVTGITAEPEKS
ncbi:hypothetical protein GQ55_8G235900 [Panicum hallii var. hallii]|uniref:Hydroxyproline-rich glycoprotein family protein n=2 Tax=Panicum hallii TaxID=206008 RepID=A0A2T7CQG3_9POAL|nr:hypothetical protein PAHAL_8G239300 [Panicum hallii]PUZ45580.1 hypothetical protein GQ55_8G235900 [Panicum hallii var. hallii]PVH34529.1 hypothetical protein PAHAL_8G239300 [Panicum hallii]